MTTFIGAVAFIAIFVYAYKLIRHRKTKELMKRYRIGLIVSILIYLIMIGIGGGNTASDKSTQNADKADTTKIVKKKKYVGKDKYNIAKKENVALLAKEKELKKQEDKLDDQADQIKDQEAADQKAAQEQQAAAQKQQEEQAKKQEQQEQAAQQPSQNSTQTRGDMNTSDTGTIVGNVNSHIYHVPGQAGYNMNSANAVYFHSEQEAINAGYRRSKR